MSAEHQALRAAAELASELLEEHPDHGGRCEFCCAAKVVNAWLAEHPSDDDEPVTEEWLREIGFTYDDEWGATYIYGYKTFPLWYEDLCGEWGWGEAELPSPKTRGDVRRLCRALGIELKEHHHG